MNEDFFKKDVAELIKNLKPDTKPKWGILTPQAMIEHIIGSWRISNGKARAKCVVPPEKLEKLRAFLFSDLPYEKNRKNPIMPVNSSPPHRKPDLESAKTQLVEDINDFFDYHQQHPDAEFIHPVFGKLDKKGWLIFQQKHIKHHFEQFGLKK